MFKWNFYKSKNQDIDSNENIDLLKMIEILKHYMYQNSCIKFLTYQFLWKIMKYY